MVLAGRQAADFGYREEEYRRHIQHAQNTIMELQHDVHRLNNIINPIPLPGAAEIDPAVIVADDDMELDEEEEEPEELVPIDESDDEGGNVSGIDDDFDE